MASFNKIKKYKKRLFVFLEQRGVFNDINKNRVPRTRTRKGRYKRTTCQV